MSHATGRVRRAVVAGRFYEASPAGCRDEAAACCSNELPADLPARICGAVLPHAGWVCSGRVAGFGLQALHARHDAPPTFVIIGSVHTVDLATPALDEADAWATPLGDLPVNTSLRQAMAALDRFAVRDDAHVHEHSAEVLLPMVRYLWGSGAQVVPCVAPPSDAAPGWGRDLGQLLRNWDEPVVVLASSDLTHYGPNYAFTPQGPGEPGYQWAHGTNDRELLERIVAMDSAGVVVHARENRSTCGGGAIAMTIEACRSLGADRGIVLEHTDSARELAKVGYRDRANSVGYAAVVFGG